MTKSDLLSETRKLIYFPIIHTSSDLGELASEIQEQFIRRLGKKAWDKKVEMIDAFWDSIETSIHSLTLPFDKVKLYQDGLPRCGREMEIVHELAEGGSRNHQLLEELVSRGATIMGTESPELLVQEYKSIKRKLRSRISSPNYAHMRRDKQILHQRDQFISQRINESLLPGEIGILFLGMLHNVVQQLDKDIQIVYPLGHFCSENKDGSTFVQDTYCR